MKALLGALTAAALASCVAHDPGLPRGADDAPARVITAAAAVDAAAAAITPGRREALLDEIERAHFDYFVDQRDPVTGLVKDRSTPDSAASIAAVGFALTAYGVGVERGWLTRDRAAGYVRTVLGTLARLPQGPQAQGVAGHQGWFYHFLDMKTGLRTWNCELSTVDTALLMAGVRFARTYFDRPEEADLRATADALFARIDFPWALAGGELLSMGWTPEHGFIPARWKAYNESMALLLFGLGHPAHPLPAGAWQAYMAGVAPRLLWGETHVPFGPHFGHQYAHAWVDFRGLHDATTRRLGFDWFENACRATRAQHHYALANPKGWRGYGALDWGLTACDGPRDYAARGIDATDPDDGTLAPTAAAASLPYAPALVLATLDHWRRERPELWGRGGFADAFNPTERWVDPARLGIDQGPVVLMIENHRTGLVWEVMRRDPALRRGLAQAGFTGGWLAARPAPAGARDDRFAKHQDDRR